MPLYDSEEELLEDFLGNRGYKHYKQLKYLAGRHQGNILKIRFVLSPFSFVFLLAGREQFHVVMETLDTEEATYIWHIESDRQLLPQQIQKIDNDLSLIRNKGKQAFLENQPSNFSQIFHYYTDERKGFIIWRDLLEERLF